jgi:hypothetical protein
LKAALGYINLVYLICSKKVLYLLLLIIILLPLNLFAGGQKEDRIPQALELVEQRLYNDAILILTDIMKTNPDQFAEAQKLIQEISIARDKYNKLYAELIKILDPPPGEAIDEDLAYKIIRDMEALDSNPNKSAVAAFAQAKKSIVFAVDDRTYSNIMDTASGQITNEEFTEAINTYFEGFSLHLDLFVEKDYGNIVEDQVAIYQDTILKTARDFLGLYDTLNNVSEEFSNIIQNGSIQDIENGYGAYSIAILEAGEYWKKLKNTAVLMDNFRDSIQREDESDIPYISVKRVLTLGRSTSTYEEGIAGVLSTVWDKAQNSVSSVLVSKLNSLYIEAVNGFEISDFESSRNFFDNALRISLVTVDVLKLRGNKLYLDNNLVFNDNGLNYLNNELPAFLFAQGVSVSASVYTKISRLAEELGALSESIEGASTVDSIENSILSLNTIEETLSDHLTDINLIMEEDRALENTSLDLTQRIESFANLSKNHSVINENNFTLEVRAEEKILSLKIEPERISIEKNIEEIIISSDYIEGIAELINGLTLKVKRPDRATELLSQTKIKLESSDLYLDNIINDVETKKESVKSMPSILNHIESVSVLKNIIDEKKKEIDVLTENAKILNNEADDAYSLGNLRLDEAYSRFNRDNFDGARKKYYEAESLFIKSLEYREDEKVRSLLTIELAKLDSDITTALNRQIIKEVRSLITRGKDYYNLQEFIKAEQTFQQAEARYKVTNEDRNPEIDNWLIKIKRALEATSGREIALTDPLYPDIISILNLVQEEFEKGKVALKSGSKETADIHFSEAINKIELVKTPFPRNFKASVMYLQILEYTQEDTFKNFFKAMYDTAINVLDDDPKTADDDLLALYEINPDYPGIKTAIYRSGVVSGRIIPPPAQVDIKRATQLYSQAKTIVDTDNRSQFPIALAYLEEAIQINSDYDAAAILMDRIRTSTGAISQVSISSTDTQQIRYAESLYIEGRYLEANIIINQLWANPDNRKSSKLNDLKIKVEARL